MGGAMTRPDTGRGKPMLRTAQLDPMIHGLRGAARILAAVTVILSLTLTRRSLT